MVLGKVASASPTWDHVRKATSQTPTPALLNRERPSDVPLNKPSSWFCCTFNLENHWSNNTSYPFYRWEGSDSGKLNELLMTSYLVSIWCQLPPATTTVVSLLLNSHTPTFWSRSPLASGLLLKAGAFHVPDSIINHQTILCWSVPNIQVSKYTTFDGTGGSKNWRLLLQRHVPLPDPTIFTSPADNYIF